MFDADYYECLNIAVWDYKDMVFRGQKVACLPAAQEDQRRSHLLWSKCGVKVTNLENPTDRQISAFLCDIASRANQLERERIGKRKSKGGIFLVVYFAGHGLMIKGSTHILLNHPEKANRNPYPLEERLRTLCSSTNGDVYPFGIFDCCRTKCDEIARNLTGLDLSNNDGTQLLWNLVLLFGCPPS
jgi:hypothetical protein